MGKKIKIILVDDHKLFREGVKRILEFEPGLEVVAEGEDGSCAPALVKKHRPDVVLMDINMQHVNGVEATATLVRSFPDTRVIILSIHDDESYVTHALQTGAQGYLLKEMDAHALVEAIKVVSEGGSYLHPRVTHNLVKEYRRLVRENESVLTSSGIEYEKPVHILTKRECEVLQLLAEGKSNKSAAKALYISEKTIKNHVSNILQKMNATDRTQAVVEAIKKGWVDVI